LAGEPLRASSVVAVGAPVGAGAGIWYILLLGSEIVRSEQFGLASDVPVPAAYNRQ
jgi:hypothetical protein